jgi:hypothetical protein
MSVELVVNAAFLVSHLERGVFGTTAMTTRFMYHEITDGA